MMFLEKLGQFINNIFGDLFQKASVFVPNTVETLSTFFLLLFLSLCFVTVAILFYFLDFEEKKKRVEEEIVESEKYYIYVFMVGPRVSHDYKAVKSQHCWCMLSKMPQN